MEEKIPCEKSNDCTAKKRHGGFIRDFIAGVCIGIACIIPGFSGGSVAAILGVYEKMVHATANFFKEMKKSVLVLLPIMLGVFAGIMSLMFPIQLMLARFPLPTVSLFVGLAIGGVPSLTDKVKGKTSVVSICSLVIPMLCAAAISFIPMGAEVNLFDMNIGGYLILMIVGGIGSCALVVPGISGSMLLVIMGYYNPVLSLVTEHLLKFKDVGVSALALGAFGIGMVAGFFLVSVMMKQLLIRHPRGTYLAIIGFILGSLPTVYVSTMKDAGMITPTFDILSIPSSPWHYLACVFFLAVGIAATCIFAAIATKKTKAREAAE